MTKEEINEFIEDRFNKINKHFRKAIDNFESEDIRKFRTELNNHLLRRWVEGIGHSPLYVSGGGENKSKFRVWLSSFLSSPS